MVIEDPLLDAILKKNGLMLRSFGVQGVYPFLSRELKELGEALGRLNAGKRFYKQAVAETLGLDRTRHLVKIGGQTDIEYLIEDKLPLLLRCLEAEPVKSTLTEKEIREVQRWPERHYSLILQLTYLHLFHELFISGKFDSRFNEPSLNTCLDGVLAGSC